MQPEKVKWKKIEFSEPIKTLDLAIAALNAPEMPMLSFNLRDTNIICIYNATTYQQEAQLFIERFINNTNIKFWIQEKVSS